MEAIFSQLTKDYLRDYGRNEGSCKMMEDYIHANPLTAENADYIIENLQKIAKEKRRIKTKTHRVMVGKVEV